MSWGLVASVGDSVVGSLLGHHDAQKAGNQADADRADEIGIENQQLQLAKNQDQRAGELYQQYRDVFMPRQTQLVNDTFDRPISPAEEEAKATADSRSALATSRATSLRDMRRAGVTPDSGTALALDAGTGIEGARMEAGARTAARSSVRDKNFARQMSVLGLGSPTPALNAESSAISGVGDTASLAASRSRYSSNQADRASVAYGASLGDLLDSGLAAWRKRRGASNGLPYAGYGSDPADLYGSTGGV